MRCANSVPFGPGIAAAEEPPMARLPGGNPGTSGKPTQHLRACSGDLVRDWSWAVEVPP